MPKGRTIEILFTFHNVSINSLLQTRWHQKIHNLHSIMYLLIQSVEEYKKKHKLNLHSIMYLLILLPDYLYMIAAKIFTFHNVSINSINGLISSVTQNSFTFHNVSINSRFIKGVDELKKYLHSIMYLLIL